MGSPTAARIASRRYLELLLARRGCFRRHFELLLGVSSPIFSPPSSALRTFCTYFGASSADFRILHISMVNITIVHPCIIHACTIAIVQAHSPPSGSQFPGSRARKFAPSDSTRRQKLFLKCSCFTGAFFSSRRRLG